MSSESETGKIRRQKAAGRSKPAPRQSTDTSGQPDRLQVVRFTLAGHEFGVDVRCVQEIRRAADAAVTGDDMPMEGDVLNVHGQAVTVIDLRRWLGLPPAESDVKARIIVIEHEHKTFGLVVDAVTEVLRLGRLVTAPKPPSRLSLGADAVLGVYSVEDQNVTILDVAALVKT